MGVLDTPPFHVCEDVGLWIHQSSIETSISVWGTGNVVFCTWEGGREGEREGRDGEREGWREGGMEGGREGREGGRERGRGGREGERGVERNIIV